MSIRSFISIIAIALLALFINPTKSIAAKTKSNTTLNSSKADPGDDEKFAHIVQRVNEIQSMDLSSLSPSEKKALKKELRGLKKEASGLDSKVYLSVGAIIIIILLLILILK